MVSHLEEVGRQHAVPVAVVEGQRSGEAGHGDAVLDACAHRVPPRVLDRRATAGVSEEPAASVRTRGGVPKIP